MSIPSNSTTMLYLVPFIILSCVNFVLAANFHRDFDILWGNGRGNILSDGKILRLSLDESSGSGIQTKCPYFFIRIDMEIKLIPGNSAGTVTAFYLASEGDKRDEIDIEFLGNLTGEPYTVHTNIFTKGKGSREQQFHLWFDPTKNFHTYTITWNPFMIAMYVDGTPIRVFKNMESNGVPYLKDMPMRVYLSLWDGDEWATRGGTVKTNWTESPFKAWFRNYKVQGCAWTNGESSCSSGNSITVKHDWYNLKELDSSNKEKLKLVQHKHMVYNYCNDSSRFRNGFPLECDHNN